MPSIRSDCIQMTIFCPICWSEVFPDGHAFYCYYCHDLYGQKTFNWIHPAFVFNTDTASYGVLLKRIISDPEYEIIDIN